MTTVFPSALDGLNNPDGSTLQNAGTRTHSLQHADLNDGMEAVQSKLGVTNSSDVNSMDYKVRQVRPVYNVMKYGAVGNGIANDTAAFVAAIGAGGRNVYVPLGTYLIDLVYLPANTRLFGDGDGSYIRPASMAPANMLYASGDNVEVTGVNLQATPLANYLGTVPLKAASVKRFYAHDLVIQGSGSPFVGFQCTDSMVERCTVTGYNDNGITFNGVGSARNTIAFNKVDGTSSTGGGVGCQHNDSSDSLIIGNTVNGSYVFGCYLGSCQRSMMIGNYTLNTRLEGLQATDSSYCTIANNTCAWNGAIGQDFGISLWATLAGGGRYNTVSNNTVVRSGKAGIQIEGNAGFPTSHNKIVGNTVYNCNYLNQANAGGIMLYGSACTDTLVQGNEVYSDNGQMAYGVTEIADGGGFPANNQIKGNKIVGATIKPINKQATSTEANNGKRLLDSPWTPTVTSETGTITTSSVSEAKYYEMERMVFISLAFSVTTVGTGAGAILVTVPFNMNSGRQPNFTALNVGTGLAALKSEANGATLSIRKPDNTTPLVAGGIYTVSGWYERD